MTAREGFALAVRIGGAWKILESTADIYYVLVKMMGLPTSSALPVAVDIETGIWRVLVGMVLILAAEPLTRLIYGAKSAATE